MIGLGSAEMRNAKRKRDEERCREAKVYWARRLELGLLREKQIRAAALTVACEGEERIAREIKFVGELCSHKA